MNIDKIIEENAVAEAQQETSSELKTAAEEHSHEETSPAEEDSKQLDDVQHLLQELGVSESIAASARVIVQSLRQGNASSESIVKLVVQALRHDEDLKNAETQGYLRGRNEVIAATTTPPDDKSPRPLNFPIYTKRSFWDK
ncbi:MAG: hypothetical protein IKW83_04375 [Muribaculaceae bacterium]|nr:hypothetical protein [Muribaculaceae bacterium]